MQHPTARLDNLAAELWGLRKRVLESARAQGADVDAALAHHAVDEAIAAMRRLGLALHLEGAETIGRGFLDRREREEPASAPTAGEG